MDAAQELAQQHTQGKGDEDTKTNGDNRYLNSMNNNHNNNTSIINKDVSLIPKVTHYKKWLKLTIYTFLVLACNTVATLLGRLYFTKGGQSKWMATLVQSAGFPVLIPFIFFLSSTPNAPRPWHLRHLQIYVVLGLIVFGDNLMYSIGLRYLPVSTYSLLCATQLAFNAVTSFFINAQKFTALIINSVVLLTISACLLAVNADNEGSDKVARGKYIIGFLCTIGASATYSLLLSLVQLAFEKVIKDESLYNIVSIQLYSSVVATCASLVGLFSGREWRTLTHEMNTYEAGKVSYVMVLAFTAISWQIYSIGLIGLIFEVSSLFSNVISTVGLPLVPIFAVVFFHDSMNGVKVISLILAVWGFISYIYQHYLNESKANNKARKEVRDETPLVPSTEMC